MGDREVSYRERLIYPTNRKAVMGLPIKENLYTELLCEGAIISPSGEVFYGTDEIYGKLLQ